MRNDARPMGEDAADESPVDSRDSVKHDRQSPVAHENTERDTQRDDHDIEPTMPTADSTLNTKI
jgi:hypothetical protein